MPIIQRIDGDIDFLDLHELYPTRYPHILQTVARQQSELASYDILFAYPQQTLQLDNNNQLSLLAAHPDREYPESPNRGFEAECLANSGTNFLTVFDVCWQAEKARCKKEDTAQSYELPFHGGWFIYLGYELAGQVEPSLELPKASSADLPVAFATRFPAALIKNHQREEIYLVVEEQYAEYAQCVADDVQQCLAGKRIRNAVINARQTRVVQAVHEEDANRYIQSVQKIKRYIKAGDVFQVNLSRLWQISLVSGVCATDIYRALRLSNPAPFFALTTYHQHAIISSSPERLVSVKDRLIQTRPIAGTRPRGNSKAQDVKNLNELIAHPKERAEHIMLIDLERNDLGRVCVPGTVQVSELMVLESYAHVHHIVSNIQGQLPTDTTPGDIINAVFPGGTITGCPKVRCMEILSELERAPRGAYTGSLGYVNHDGSMDLNILIRTLQKNGNTIQLRAGGGIVADSIAEKELQETRAKAKGLLLALGVDV